MTSWQWQMVVTSWQWQMVMTSRQQQRWKHWLFLEKEGGGRWQHHNDGWYQSLFGERSLGCKQTLESQLDVVWRRWSMAQLDYGYYNPGWDLVLIWDVLCSSATKWLTPVRSEWQPSNPSRSSRILWSNQLESTRVMVFEWLAAELESPYLTFTGRTSDSRIPLNSMHNNSSAKQWGLVTLSAVQLRIRRTPSGATLLLEMKWVNTSDGWEPTLANERADRRRPCQTGLKCGFLEKLVWSSGYETGLWL